MNRHSLRFSSLFALGLLVQGSACSDPCIDDGVSLDNCEAPDGATAVETTSTSSTATESGTQLRLCQDADGDSFGNPAQCQDSTSPKDGWVADNTDCDDTDAHTFPGAAEHEGAACSKDSDNDGWGDDDPKPGVTPGTDCDDTNADTYPGAAENEADLCAKDSDDDGWGDHEHVDGVDPGLDCNDNDPTVTPTSPGGASCLDALTVSAGEDQVLEFGASATITAVAAGGSGHYAFAWTPTEDLSAPNEASTSASPKAATDYVVTVTDTITGLTASDSVNLSFGIVDVNLEDDCSIWDLGTQNDALEEPMWIFSDEGKTACQFTNNNSSALLCPGRDAYTLVGSMWVPHFPGGPDNDWIGLIWNVNAERTRYQAFDWKQAWQVHDFCGLTNYAPGMRIKEIELKSADAVLTCDDLVGEFDTTQSKILRFSSEIEGGKTPWITNERYRFAVTVAPGGVELAISDSNGDAVAATSFESTGLSGQDFGLFGFSQDRICFSNLQLRP
jgi:hypothetical protein